MGEAGRAPPRRAGAGAELRRAHSSSSSARTAAASALEAALGKSLRSKGILSRSTHASTSGPWWPRAQTAGAWRIKASRAWWRIKDLVTERRACFLGKTRPRRQAWEPALRQRGMDSSTDTSANASSPVDKSGSDEARVTDGATQWGTACNTKCAVRETGRVPKAL
jgi:hypothetical protein